MLPNAAPKGDVFRIALRPDPWQLSDQALLRCQGRYDDPERVYHVLYASSRFGCFMETLARFRPPLADKAEIQRELDAIDCENDLIPFGEVPAEWASSRLVGCAKLYGSYADVCSSEWLAHIRVILNMWCVAHGIIELDASTMQSSAPRAFTQQVSRLVFGHPERFDGIRYLSKWGHDIENWALFDGLTVSEHAPEAILTDDPDFRRAMNIFGIRLHSPGSTGAPSGRKSKR